MDLRVNDFIIFNGDIKYTTVYGFKYFIKGKIFKDYKNVKNVKGLINMWICTLN